MKVFRSTQYVSFENQKTPFLKLEVINQFDFKTKPICFRTFSNTTVYYCLQEITPITETASTFKVIDKPTKEVLQQIENLGYTIL